jgi:flagella basal body P-ring formation protein FlgA
MKDTRNYYRSAVQASVGLALIVLIALCVQMNAEAFEVIMQEGVVVEVKDIFVKDIASVRGENETLLNEVNNVYLCKAPNPGYAREIDRAYLIMKLKQQKLDIEGVTFSGAGFTKVTVQEYVVTVEQQQSALTAWISGKIDIPADQLHIVYRKEPRDIVVTAEDIDLLFKGDENTFMGRSVGVYLELYHNEELIKRSAFNFSLALAKEIVVPARAINKGEAISINDLELEQQLVPVYDRDYFSDITAIVGSVAAQDMCPSQRITAKDIRARTIVERGQMVECSVKDKNMRLGLALQACEAGVRGDMIRLINPATEKTVRGVVVGEAQVELVI